MLLHLSLLIIGLLTASPKCYGRSINNLSGSLKSEISEESSLEATYLPLEVLCEVNGYMINGLIDTGAQISIMSQACAEKCMLMDHIDNSHVGRVLGMGISEITGRIHQMPVRIGPVSFSNSVSIIKNSRVDFILGLDFLRKHRCELCLDDNSIKIHASRRVFRIPFIHDYYESLSKPQTTLSSTLDASPKFPNYDSHSSSFGDENTDSESELEEFRREIHHKTENKVQQKIREQNSKTNESIEYYPHWDECEDSNDEFLSMEGL